MNAVVLGRYGGPEVLRIAEVARPKMGDDEVVVRVLASSINSWDAAILRGRFPRSGQLRPKIRVLGADMAGRVEAVGKDVTLLRTGDHVFADIQPHGWGGFGEYVSVPERALAQKPPAMSFEQAAAVPQAGILAMQALRKGRLVSGQSVLLNGAGGGVGTFAVQMAKAMGAEVTGVDHGRKLDRLRSLGFDHVIDYEKQDFTRDGQKYDLIVDVEASRSARAYQRALRPGGRCVLVGGSVPRLLLLAAFGSMLMTRGRKVGLLLYKPNPDDLVEMNRLFEQGKVTPVIDSAYPLDQIQEAFRRFEAGTFVGKIVITIDGGAGS